MADHVLVASNRRPHDRRPSSPPFQAHAAPTERQHGGRHHHCGRLPMLVAIWCTVALLVAVAPVAISARYLPTRAKSDGVDRLRELLRDVLVTDQQPPPASASTSGVSSARSAAFLASVGADTSSIPSTGGGGRLYGVSQFGPPPAAIRNHDNNNAAALIAGAAAAAQQQHQRKRFGDAVHHHRRVSPAERGDHAFVTTPPLSLERLLAAADLDEDELTAALAAARDIDPDGRRVDYGNGIDDDLVLLAPPRTASSLQADGGGRFAGVDYKRSVRHLAGVDGRRT